MADYYNSPRDSRDFAEMRRLRDFYTLPGEVFEEDENTATEFIRAFFNGQIEVVLYQIRFRQTRYMSITILRYQGFLNKLSGLW